MRAQPMTLSEARELTGRLLDEVERRDAEFTELGYGDNAYSMALAATVAAHEHQDDNLNADHIAKLDELFWRRLVERRGH